MVISDGLVIDCGFLVGLGWLAVLGGGVCVYFSIWGFGFLGALFGYLRLGLLGALFVYLRLGLLGLGGMHFWISGCWLFVIVLVS